MRRLWSGGGHDGLGARITIFYIVFPLFTNLFVLIFEALAIKIYQASSQPTNVIGVIGLFVWYINGLLHFTMYGRSTGGWKDVFGSANACLVVSLVACYPIFFLFWLPYIMFQTSMYFGTPRKIWNRIFSDSCMSTDNLVRDFTTSTGQLVCRYFYIGIPFGLFSLILILLMAFTSPIWYWILSPTGLGTLGVALHVSLHYPHTLESDVVERIHDSEGWGIFIHVFTLALPFFVLGIAHMASAGFTWYALLITLIAGLEFLSGCYPAVKKLCGELDTPIYRRPTEKMGYGMEF